MAVIKVPQTCKLVFKVETGVNAAGKAVVRVRQFAHVRPEAAEEQLLAIGQSLAGLQRHTLAGISRIEDAKLVNQ